MPNIVDSNNTTIFAIKRSYEMSNPYFKFKKFTVWHDLCSMKVGTDGVLLGAWSSHGNPLKILDVGSGTGLIALMLAQRFPEAKIDAIDIDVSAYEQTSANVTGSPFSDRIMAVHISIQDYAQLDTEVRYDLIVSNPPFFENSFKSPDSGRTLARHTDTLPLTELLACSAQLLAPSGRLAMILPYSRAEAIIDEAVSNGLLLAEQTDVIPVVGAIPKRSLLSFVPAETPVQPIRNELTIEWSRHVYTDEFKQLTADFYLKH